MLPHWRSALPIVKRHFCASVRRSSKKADDSWKYTSNYFNNSWNRQIYGAVKSDDDLVLAEISKQNGYFSEKPKIKKKDNDEDYWIDTVQEKISTHKIQASLSKQSDLERSIASASLDLQDASHVYKPAVVKNESKVSHPNFDYQVPESIFPVALDKVSRKQNKERNRELKRQEFDKRFSSERHPLLTKSKPLVSKFGDLESLIADTIKFKRADCVPDFNTPSVTKILKETMPVKRKLALQAWEERMIAQMGRENFELMQQNTLARGERLHEAVEEYFDSGELPDAHGSNIEDEVSQKHLRSIGEAITKFQTPAVALESQVQHPDLNYKGYLDAVASYNNKKLVLVDWKTSNKDKLTLSATFDAPLQIAAYVGALNHDVRYPFQVEQAMIVVVYNDGRPASVINMTTKQVEKYWNEWLGRLKLYAKMKEFNVAHDSKLKLL